MRSIGQLAMIVAAALAVSPTAGCSQETQADRAFGDRVKAYLMRHPEVIEQAMNQLQAQRDAETERKARAAVGANRKMIERDPADFVANPNGKVTVAEFFDYKCPYCKVSSPAVLDLIAKNPDVRFVFKELPILTETSNHAAEAQLSANRANGRYLEVFRALMAENALDDAGVERIVREHGVDLARLDPTAKAAADKHIAETRALAKLIGADGTPAFVVGDHVIAGWAPEQLQADIDETRRKGS